MVITSDHVGSFNSASDVIDAAAKLIRGSSTAIAFRSDSSSLAANVCRFRGERKLIELSTCQEFKRGVA